MMRFHDLNELYLLYLPMLSHIIKGLLNALVIKFSLVYFYAQFEKFGFLAYIYHMRVVTKELKVSSAD